MIVRLIVVVLLLCCNPFAMVVDAAVLASGARRSSSSSSSDDQCRHYITPRRSSNFGTILAAKNQIVRRSYGTTAITPPPKTASTFLQTVAKARRHLVAAAIARTVSILAMYPVDSIKTRIQMQQTDVMRWKGIFKGATGSLLGQVPYGVLTFGSYEVYKQALLEKFADTNVSPVFLYAAAAVAGDLTGSGWLCPSEVLKQKVQAGIFGSTMEAVGSIWKTKGVVGFYEGYWGGVTRDVPFRVAQLTTYEVTKNLYLRIKQQQHHTNTDLTKQSKQDKRKTVPNSKVPAQEQLSPLEAAFCGAISGSFSAAITAPLDRFKTLLMTDSQAYGGSVTRCAITLWQAQGIRGFFTGIVPRVVYIAPSVAIFFVAYEMTQQHLQHW